MIGIPLPTPGEQAHFELRVTLDQQDFYIQCEWNQRESYWYLTLSDADGEAIVRRKLVADWDLLYTCADARRPPGKLVAVDLTGAGRPPGYGELGGRVSLVYVEAADLD